ncbi:hypothetical protein CU048_04390 [Beijerinckiaceae bacterium]|nr:hypothetical protein CU048_04390 [Beijerinckiaceae bacterium]
MDFYAPRGQAMQDLEECVSSAPVSWPGLTRPSKHLPSLLDARLKAGHDKPQSVSSKFRYAFCRHAINGFLRAARASNAGSRRMCLIGSRVMAGLDPAIQTSAFVVGCPAQGRA